MAPQILFAKLNGKCCDTGFIAPLSDPTDQLPKWVLSAMRCLAHCEYRRIQKCVSSEGHAYM